MHSVEIIHFLAQSDDRKSLGTTELVVIRLFEYHAPTPYTHNVNSEVICVQMRSHMTGSTMLAVHLGLVMSRCSHIVALQTY